MDNLFSAQNGVLAALTSAIVLIAGTSYKVYRMVKEDIKVDKNVTNSEKWQEEKTSRIKDLEEKQEKFLERVEQISKERNTAIELTGALKGEITALKYRAEEADRLETENDKFKEEIKKLNRQIENILEINGFSKTLIETPKKEENRQ